MKQINKRIYLVFLLTIIAMFGWISTVHSSFSTAHDKALTFIENVLPIDSTKYTITLRNYGMPKLPELGLTQPNNAKQEILTYSLESKDSVMDVICTIQNDVLYSCNVYVLKGAVISDRPYSDVIDAVTSFLQKYQAYSKMDSTEMIAMLSNIDLSKNMTTISGNLKLTVTHIDLTGTAFGDTIDFRWVQTFNECDYLSINIYFSNGFFSGFIDHRAIYAIGDTSVNISKEQAIKIALDAIKNYSYRMSDDWVVMGFDVIEDRAVAKLQPQIRASNVLYPVWSVTLPLNGTWPGSVRELLVEIWAGSGEVRFVHHQAYGGAGYLLDSTSSSDSVMASPSASPPESNGPSIDLSIVVVICVAAVAVVVTAILMLIKKRRE